MRQRLARGARVICRTLRGLEVGEVLAGSDATDEQAADGTLLRRVTIEDDLLIARLEKNRDEAYPSLRRPPGAARLRPPCWSMSSTCSMASRSISISSARRRRSSTP